MLCGLFLWPLGAAADEQQPLPESAVLSAYLVNFLHFVEWPESAFASPEDAYLLCVLGAEDLLKTLETMAEGQERRGRGIRVRALEDLAKTDGCHVLYIDPQEWSRVEDGFPALLQRPLLTVSRSRDFLDAGGGINLLAVDQRLRFEVGRDALDSSGLRVDSRLLDAATTVRQSKRKRRRKP